MRRTLFVVTLMTVLAAAIIRADRGTIPFEPGVSIFEPVQRAMIAWNGREEILLLSTDLRASADTRVLEVLPLPAEPVVTEGDVEVFQRVNHLINQKLLLKQLDGRPATNEAGRGRGPAGEITFHERIGAHDITVAHVLDAGGFTAWVEKYLPAAGAERAIIPEPLRRVIAEYLADGFTWFVFDLVDLRTEVLTNDAVQYRFATDTLYYPLRITRTETGWTEVDLIVLTPRLLTRFPGLPTERVRLMHEPVSITAAELQDLNPDMAGLFPGMKDLKLRVWRIQGDLPSFTADLLAR